MSDNTPNNQRIAKNTVLIYIRTAFVLFISLYTTRLVLQALGETDLGVYNVVGGIVSLMAFLQAAQSKATSRFITFEIGKGNGKDAITKVFSASCTIHLIIVLIILVLGETIGLWMVTHWITVPPERINAAMVVYQCALLTFSIHIIRVPFDASVIAYEEMGAFAVFSIIEAVIKLSVPLILLKSSFDHLIGYSVLHSVAAIIFFLMYYIYIRIKHGECKFRILWEKELSIKMISFSSWTLLGSASNTATQQGVSILFNNFVGLVANTALGFANQVNAALGTFVSSFTTAFNPQIIKYCAKDEYSSMHILMNRASKFSFALAYVFALPLIVNMDYILHLWLGTVPQYTTSFCQLILICSVIDATTGVFNTSITATGKIKGYQISITCSFLLDLLCAYLLLFLKYNPVIVFGSRILTRGIFNMFIGFYFAKRQLSFDIVKYSKVVLFPVLATIIISLPVAIYITRNLSGFTGFVISIVSQLIIVGLCSLFIIMNHSERNKCISMLKVKIGL